MPVNWGLLPYHFSCVLEWLGKIWSNDTARRSILIVVMLAMVVIAQYYIWTN